MTFIKMPPEFKATKANKYYLVFLGSVVSTIFYVVVTYHTDAGVVLPKKPYHHQSYHVEHFSLSLNSSLSSSKLASATKTVTPHSDKSSTAVITKHTITHSFTNTSVNEGSPLPVSLIINAVTATIANPVKKLFNDHSTITALPILVPTTLQTGRNVSTTRTSSNRVGITSARSAEPKVVLFWTSYFSSTNWSSILINFDNDTLPGKDNVTSLNQTCFFTSNRSILSKADAVVFHGRNINFKDLPNMRSSWQRWIFYLLENPFYSLSGAGFKRANAMAFNWTMTYHERLSDVWSPYCRLIPRENASREAMQVVSRIESFAEAFSKRPKDAIWIVSHCKTLNKREALVNQLSASDIKVDIFGGCSKRKPEKVIEEAGGEEKFFSQYKFYLSFENALCDEYVTEKFGYGLEKSIKYGLIPIVYGGSLKKKDYTKIAPEGSYVDVEKFDSVKNLIAFMNLLKSSNTSNQALVASFMQWHLWYESVDCNYARIGFENLCRKLVAESETKCRARSTGELSGSEECRDLATSTEHIKERLGECRSPRFRL